MDSIENQSENENLPVAAGSRSEDSYGLVAVSASGDTAAEHTSAHAKALILAKFAFAERRPRNIDDVQKKLERLCRKPAFAKLVEYSKPAAGTSFKGVAVAMADEAIKLYGNVHQEETVVYEDDKKRIIKVEVIDLESNISKIKSVTVKKTVERRNPTEGRVTVSKRKNSRNQWVYEIEATDEEILGKENALIAKARRNKQLELIPRYVIDECMVIARECRNLDISQDPDLHKNQILDAFQNIGVSAKDLTRYIGHSLDLLTVSEIAELRSMYESIAAKESTFKEFLDEKIMDGDVPGETSATAKAVQDGLKEAKSGGKTKSAPGKSAQADTCTPSSPPPGDPDSGTEDTAQDSQKPVERKYGALMGDDNKNLSAFLHDFQVDRYLVLASGEFMATPAASNALKDAGFKPGNKHGLGKGLFIEGDVKESIEAVAALSNLVGPGGSSFYATRGMIIRVLTGDKAHRVDLGVF